MLYMGYKLLFAFVYLFFFIFNFGLYIYAVGYNVYGLLEMFMMKTMCIGK